MGDSYLINESNSKDSYNKKVSLLYPQFYHQRTMLLEILSNISVSGMVTFEKNKQTMHDTKISTSLNSILFTLLRKIKELLPQGSTP